MERADWEAARVAFEAVLEAGESADARDGLGQALWFLGDVAGGIAMRERAFEEHVRAGRCDDAARMAVWVSHQHFIAGRASAARGWLARSERALEDVDGCAGHGWVAVERARHAGSVEEQIAHARRAMEIARENDADDLEVFALSLLGRAEVNAGQREHGMALLEEAMAAATAGRVRNVHTLAEAYCNLIEACAGAGEWERAQEWCETGRRLRPHARDRPAVRRLPHGPRGRPGRGRALAGGRARARERAGHARALRPADGRAGDRQDGRAARAAGAPRGGRAAPGAARRSSRRRCGRSRCCASPRTGRRWRRRCWSEACGAPRATPSGPPSCWRRSSTPASPAATWPAPARPPTSSRRSRPASGIRLIGARAELAAARVALAAGDDGAAAESAQRALAAFGALAMPFDVGEARLELARAIAGEAPELAGRRGTGGARRVPRARRVPGAGRRRRAAARARRSHRRARPRHRRAHRARAGGARAGRARDVQRADRQHARDQREDRGPPRQPHPDEARRAATAPRRPCTPATGPERTAPATRAGAAELV